MKTQVNDSYCLMESRGSALMSVILTREMMINGEISVTCQSETIFLKRKLNGNRTPVNLKRFFQFRHKITLEKDGTTCCQSTLFETHHCRPVGNLLRSTGDVIVEVVFKLQQKVDASIKCKALRESYPVILRRLLPIAPAVGLVLPRSE